MAKGLRNSRQFSTNHRSQNPSNTGSKRWLREHWQISKLKREQSDLQTRISGLEREKATLFERVEQAIASNLAEEPAFGFVYQNHEELGRKVKIQAETIKSLKTKLAIATKKSVKHERDSVTSKLSRRTFASLEVELAARVADYDAILQDFTLASAELQELEALLKEKDLDISILRAEIEGRNGHSMDPLDFLKESYSEKDISLPSLGGLVRYSTDPIYIEPKIPMPLAVYPFLPLSNSSLIYQTAGTDPLSHLVCVLPRRRYNATASNWSTAPHGINTCEVMELLIHYDSVPKQSSWFHVGRYECAQICVAPAERIWKNMEYDQKEALVKLTFEAIDSATQDTREMISGLYENGILKVYCYALRRVAFDRRLDQALHTSSTCEKETFSQIFGDNASAQDSRKCDGLDVEFGGSKRRGVGRYANSTQDA